MRRRLILAVCALTLLKVTPSAEGEERREGPSVAGFNTAVAPAASPGRPVLQLEKTVYAPGESIRVWSGMSPDDDKTPIEMGAWDSYVLHIVQPDGSEVTELAGHPLEGPVGSGWIMSCELTKVRAVPGTYRVTFAHAGRRTAPQTFIVKETPLLNDVSVRWEFDGTPPDVGAMLVVENKSGKRLRFPRPAGAATCIRVRRQGDGREAWFTYGSLSDVFGWHFPDHAPTEVLGPGVSFRERIALRDARWNSRETAPFSGPGVYSVTYETVFEFLVGEKDGPDAGLCPIRWPVRATKLFTVRE